MAVEELFVNAFDLDTRQWTELGLSPFLHDTVDDYIKTKITTLRHGNFYFADSAVGTGTINSVKLKIWAKRTDVANLFHVGAVVIYIWDGSSFVNPGNIILTITEEWYELDISDVLDSWSKIDGCVLYVISACTNAYVWVYKAKLVIDYTPVVAKKPVGDGLTFAV